jgi:hypothetical protein
MNIGMNLLLFASKYNKVKAVQNYPMRSRFPNV